MKNENQIFSHETVAEYLSSILSSEQFGRGSRAKLAEVIGVQSSFISLVTTARTILTLEQGIKTAKFLSLDELETQFLMILIQIERSGSEDLKKYFTREKDKILNKHNRIKNRIRVVDSVSVEDQQVYYSHANYALIHILAILPEYQNREKLAHVLGVSRYALSVYLKFLVSRGFIEADRSTGGYKIGKARIHLPAGSPSIPKHHANLRNHAIQFLGHQNPNHLHYSAVLGLSKETYQKIKKIILESIETSEIMLKKSKPETAAVLNIDWYHFDE